MPQSQDTSRVVYDLEADIATLKTRVEEFNSNAKAEHGRGTVSFYSYSGGNVSRVQSFDYGADGKIPNELLNGAIEQLRADFASNYADLDFNKDGKITLDEKQIVRKLTPEQQESWLTAYKIGLEVEGKSAEKIAVAAEAFRQALSDGKLTRAEQNYVRALTEVEEPQSAPTVNVPPSAIPQNGR